MEQDITINGTTYENIKNIVVQSEDGTNQVVYNQTSGVTADDDDVVAGETYYANGEERTGTHECGDDDDDDINVDLSDLHIPWENVDNKPFGSIKEFDDIVWDGDPKDENKKIQMAGFDFYFVSDITPTYDQYMNSSINTVDDINHTPTTNNVSESESYVIDKYNGIVICYTSGSVAFDYNGSVYNIHIPKPGTYFNYVLSTGYYVKSLIAKTNIRTIDEQYLPDDFKKSVYDVAHDAGYTGGESDFYTLLSSLGIEIGNIYIGNVRPTNILHKLWVDTTDENNILLKYKTSQGDWIEISSSGTDGSGEGNTGGNVGQVGNIPWENVDNKPFDSRKPFEDIDFNGEPTVVTSNILNMDMDGTPLEAIYYKVSDTYDIDPTDFANCEICVSQMGDEFTETIDGEDIPYIVIEFNTNCFTLEGMITVSKTDNNRIDMSFLTQIEGSIVTLPEKGIYFFALYLPGEISPLQYLKYAHPADIVNKLDYKFIPEPDWYQNAVNGTGYIKNRPFYGVKLDDIEWDGNEYEYPSRDFTFNNITSKCYKVIDGNDYEKYGFESVYDFLYRFRDKSIFNSITLYHDNSWQTFSPHQNTNFTISEEWPFFVMLQTYNSVPTPIIFVNYYSGERYFNTYNVSLEPGVYICNIYINNYDTVRVSDIRFNDIVIRKLSSSYLEMNINTTNTLGSDSTDSEIPSAAAVVRYVESYIGGAINDYY